MSRARGGPACGLSLTYPWAAVPVAVVKLGSSVVAHDSGELRLSVVARICEEIAVLHRKGVDVVVVTSGAIARGKRLLELPVRPTEIAELQAASAIGQGRLYRTYDELLRELGLQSAQVLLTFFDMSARSHYLNARRTLQTLLGWRIVPVINENDTTTTDEISFGDNDFLAAQVAVLVGAQLLVLLTDTDGLYTADPRIDPAAALVAEVRHPAELADLQIGHAVSPLGSGGMRSKVVAAEMATAAGIPTVIGNGIAGGALVRAWAGEPAGTRFLAQAARHSSFKLWLKYAKPTEGTVTVDAGAARALRDGGTSLLPVGVVDVAGDFDAGDAVAVREAGAGDIGKGIANYSAGELRRVMGLKSREVRELMPRATEEAVHRDYFVLSSARDRRPPRP
jgi:glutamate 5-kinase